MFVKICGLTDETAVAAAIEAGADALGFVFAESPRKVTPEQACRLCDAVAAGTIRVAVMHHPSIDLFDEVVATFAPDWVQTDAEDFADLPAAETVKPLPVFREGATRERTRFPPRLLFEGVVSGSGKTADWDEAKRIAARAELILAGGLDSANVEAALTRIRPFGVDVSSGVESGRGRKDPAKIRAFVARVRAWEKKQ